MRRILLAMFAVMTLLVAAPLVVAAANTAHANEHATSHEAPEASTDDHGNATGDHGKSGLRAQFEAVRDGCHAKDKPENATGHDVSGWAHCIRDGYKSIFESIRAAFHWGKHGKSAEHAHNG